MTFFNKKTEVMQIELTPYGRYLYSIGKFMPHSYEFVDDDVVYKTSGSVEAQEDAHQRIINETPKLKVIRSFQDEAPQVESPPTLDKPRIMVKKQNLKQNGLYALGKSSYSSDKSPAFQATMLQGEIVDSSMYDESQGEALPIPQVEIDIEVRATLRNVLDRRVRGDINLSSNVFEDGSYIDISYTEPIIHLKEFNSLYEKENFEVEVFQVNEGGTLHPLKMVKKISAIVNGLLLDDDQIQNLQPDGTDFFEEGREDTEYMEYFFDIEVDEEIAPEILCEAVDKLEINSHFLDEEIICPDKRTDRFDIYATRVGPEDLEDCD